MPFHAHQQAQTIQEYIIPPLCELAMLLRPKKRYQIPLPKEVQKALEDLQQVLSKEVDEEHLETLHRVFKQLYLRKWTPSQGNPIPCPTIRALALLTLNKNGSFAEPKNVTGYIAKLERAIRLTSLWELKAQSELTYHGDDHLACDELEKWFTEKVESPFNSLQSLQHRASAIAYATPQLPCIWWTDRKEWRSMLYKGDPIRLDQLKAMFRNMEERVIDLWEQKVLCGLPLNIHCGQVTEDLTNKEVGYSFIVDDRNTAFRNRDRLAKAILDDPQQCARFTLKDEVTGNMTWNRTALRKWLMDYAEFQGVQLARVEMLSGGPCRGTELAAMNYKTTETRARNVHMLGDHLIILRAYHKAGALSGADKFLPYSLDGITKDLLIQDLVMARPFAEIAARLCFSNQSSIQEVYRHRLFVNYTKEFTTDRISQLMIDFALPTLNIRMGLNAYRHIYTAWRRKLCPEASTVADDGDDFDTVGALHAGHSRSVENRIYGLSAESLMGSEDILPLYLNYSVHWQVKMNVVPG